MPLSVIVGGFFGDEGKGKIISYLAVKDEIHIAARGGVGPNAGHTVILGKQEYKLRQLPSAVINAKTRLLIGPGVLVNPKILLEEIEKTNTTHRVGVDAQAGIIEQKHIEVDSKNAHLSKKIGTTKTGCGPANADRALRVLKVAKEIEELKPFITNVAIEVNEALDEGKNVLLEGTQGTFLSLYHGTYPYVTSKDVTASAICSDVGVGPKKVDEVIVVFKAYVTRVGAGPLEGELPPEEIKRRGWEEYGTVTGRLRRASEFNFELARKAIMLNSATQIALTKLDKLYPETSKINDYNKLPRKAKDFIEEIETKLKTPVTLIGTGPDLKDIIDLRKEKL
ncbi:MAG: adenylosuccinate synthetase [Candidatus Njordarchaeia archaeon]